MDDSVLLGRHRHEGRCVGVVRIEDQRGRRDVFHELVEVDGGEVDVAGVVRRRFGGHHCFWKGAMRAAEEDSVNLSDWELAPFRSGRP